MCPVDLFDPREICNCRKVLAQKFNLGTTRVLLLYRDIKPQHSQIRNVKASNTSDKWIKKMHLEFRLYLQHPIFQKCSKMEDMELKPGPQFDVSVLGAQLTVTI